MSFVSSKSNGVCSIFEIRRLLVRPRTCPVATLLQYDDTQKCPNFFDFAFTDDYEVADVGAVQNLSIFRSVNTAPAPRRGSMRDFWRSRFLHGSAPRIITLDSTWKYFYTSSSGLTPVAFKCFTYSSTASNGVAL